MKSLKTFLKLSLIAYAGGMIGMWAFISAALIFYPDYNAVLNLISGIVVLPFTPLGIPFFVGAMAALTYINSRSETKPSPQVDLGPGHE